ncbi:efflux RND transporter permease subunit [Rhodobacter sp. KR11]|uniref:efflux RND transporter permease subunit n=1 Tax=Rhodobacter sp. KR11 TaxID=2974588 RepID=UPI00222214FD|nr:efflux RND transporter permease subunit [Rhodobacter sp. KR11]MCW1918000.1 efflux RND transporter permease subunit [Rhodobacter sp. KR11]
MNFSAWSIRNPVAPLLAFAMLLLVGIQSFFALPITRFPNIDVPIIVVSASQPGAAPAELEGQVAKVIEDALAGVAGVKNITTNISDGNATILVEYRMEVETAKALQDTKDAVDRIIADLPADVETPNIVQLDIEGQAILTYAVSSTSMTYQELSIFVDDEIKRSLQGKPGIGRVDIAGGADREILIALDPVRLDSYGITAQAVSGQLKITNTNVGGGRAEFGAGEQAIRTMGDTQDVARLAATPIALPSGTQVRLDHLGTISDTTRELRSYAMSGDTPVVTFGIYRSKGASEVSAAETAFKEVDRIIAAHPEVQITKVDDMVKFTYGNYEAALSTLLEGALLAVIVVFIFLKNWRATLISAVALPLSAIPTFWVMDMLGFSLNLVSFLSLTLATGILVDDAIVEIENIARHIRMGKSPFKAAMEAADEIGLAVIATTSTIIAVFVPVSFMPGIPGQYFRQFGITVAVAVFFSLIVARLITPMMAAYLMRSSDGGTEHDHADGAITRAYMRFVTASTSKRWYYATFAAAVVTVIMSIMLMLTVPGSFLPPEDNGRVTVFAQLPPGSRLEDTRKATDQIYASLKDIPHIQNILIMGGTSPTGDLDVRNATINVILEPLDHSLLLKLSQVASRIPLIGPLLPQVENHGRPVPQDQISAEVFKRLAQIPDIRVRKLDDRGSPEFSYSLLADNEDDLNAAARMVVDALRPVQTLDDVIADGALPRPELQITPRADEAARLGVTAQAIAATVRVATVGDFDAALPKVSLDDKQIPIRVQLSQVSREDVARISNLKVQTKTGAMVPLSTVADVKLGEGPATVKRFNRQRLVLIAANLPLGVALGTATEDFTKATEGLQLPGTARLVASGDAEVQAEMSASFGNAMLLGLLLMLSVLILLFGSIIQPFTILFSLLLSVGGVAVALIVTGSALSMPVLIGILMLMGIVAKNAILLIDFAIEMRARGMDRVKAVIEAGHKRAQPIVMTSIAMSAGMLPSALGVGEGGAFRAPMATAVIGGIIVSTVLSLVVVPSFYLIMDDLSWLLGKVFGGVFGKGEKEQPVEGNEILAERIALLAAEQADLREKLAEATTPRLRPGMAAE